MTKYYTLFDKNFSFVLQPAQIDRMSYYRFQQHIYARRKMTYNLLTTKTVDYDFRYSPSKNTKDNVIPIDIGDLDC